MKQIGIIGISFREYRDGIFYYNLDIEIQNKKKNIILPRYDIFLGWIEIFGLPPQNEWVVLRDIENFKKSAVLTVDDEDYNETVTYTHDRDKKKCILETERSSGEMSEQCVWSQTYKNAPHEILNQTSFRHSGGVYTTKWTTSVLGNTELLSKNEVSFVTSHIEDRGKPDVLIKKKLSAAGLIPPLYYTLFPVEGLLRLDKVEGTMVEVGYLNKKSEFEIDTVHGDWFKRFDAGGHVLYIIESMYSSCDVAVDNKIVRIKNTYRKELFSD